LLKPTIEKRKIGRNKIIKTARLKEKEK